MNWIRFEMNVYGLGSKPVEMTCLVQREDDVNDISLIDKAMLAFEKELKKGVK